MRWFRFYDEVLDKTKVQRLPLRLFRGWVNVLCIANRGTPRGILPGIEDMAHLLRVTESSARRLLDDLQEHALLDVTDAGLMPHDWPLYQPPSDDSYPRVKRTRGRDSNGGEPVTATAQIRREEIRVEEKRAVTLGDQEFILPPGLLDRWVIAYPAVDVKAELRAAFEWAQANPQNRKSNWQRFLVAWLKRSQDRAPAKGNGPAEPVKQRPAVLDDAGIAPEQAAANRARAAGMVAQVAGQKGMP